MNEASELAQFRSDSEARLARLKSTDTLKGLFLRRYLELFRGIGGAAMETRALAVIGERRVHDFLDYPYGGMVRVGLELAEELAPRYGGVEPWLREMGRLATSSYLESLLGRAFLATFQPSPRTMLTGMPWAISSCFSFGERRVSFDGARHAVFRCRSEFSPSQSNAGAVQAAVTATGARNVVVLIEQLDVFNYDLDVSW